MNITVDDFKRYFYRDNNFDFQPGATWVKTTYSAGEFAESNNHIYVSLVDNNYMPTDSITDWQIETNDYNSTISYSIGDIVVYNNLYYESRENNNVGNIGNQSFWTELSKQDVFNHYNCSEWEQPIIYNISDIVVYQGSDFKFKEYKSIINTNNLSPDNTTAWSLVSDSIDYVLDEDILKAMGEGSFYVSSDLMMSEERRKVYELYLTAFFVVYDNEMAEEGLTSSNGSAGPITERRVGDMAMSYAQSTLFKQYPDYEFFSKNAYGIKAFNLVRRYLRGNFRVVTSRGLGF